LKAKAQKTEAALILVKITLFKPESSILFY